MKKKAEKIRITINSRNEIDFQKQIETKINKKEIWNIYPKTV